MATRTLLDMVQSILSDTNGDNVNSIGATTASLQVATILKNTYFSLIADLELPATMTTLSLDSSADTDHPTEMTIPSDIEHVEWIRYDQRVDLANPVAYELVDYYTPDMFLEYIMNRASDAAEVQTVTSSTGSGVKFLILNNHWPMCWTSFDDRTIVFDAFNSAIESTLQSAKTMCWGSKTRTWLDEDDFVPDLPSDLFPLLYSKAITFVQSKLRQVADPEESKNARNLMGSARRGRVPQDGGQVGWGRQCPGAVGRGKMYDR